MAEAQQRPPFKIVIREVVNKFLSKRSSEASAGKDTVQEKTPEAGSALEPETLFDDSEPFDGLPKAKQAKDYPRVRDDNNGNGKANNDDEDDDAIFGEIETQALRDAHCAPKITRAERPETTLESGFVTAAGKKTTVSFQALEAVKQKLADTSPPPTSTPRPAEVITGFKSGRGGSIKVSLNALTACEKVFDEEVVQKNPPESPQRDQMELRTTPSESTMPPNSSITDRKEAQVLGFTTARGTVQKISEKALKEVRKMFTEEFPEESGPDGISEGPQVEKGTCIEPITLTGQGKSLGVSVSNTQGAPLPGFKTARGTVQKVAEKALREVRMMFREEFPDVSGSKAEPDEPARATKSPRTSSLGFTPVIDGTQEGAEKNPEEACMNPQAAFSEVADGSTSVKGQASLESGFSTARGKSVSVSKENLDRAKKLLEDACADREEQKSEKDCTPSGSNITSAVNGSVQSIQKENNQDSKTPARRFAGLKRRSPMCHTPLNRLSSPITPLRTPSSSSGSTPFRTLQQEKQPAKRSRVLDDIKENQNGDKPDNKIKLTDLTLLDRTPATGDSTWFRDDVSKRKVHLEDVKRSFRREISVRSQNFDCWFANHFEMVVWKLANYSGRVKELAGCLIVENVLDQLKHRWNVEHDGKRSPLRMIAERDAPAESTMVLLIKDVRPNHLILTDGWYSLPCDVDVPLQALISRGYLRTGQKLCICGAYLKGAPNGVDPLEPLDARLLIRYNSTRRARWYAKMGFVRRSLLVPLFSISLDGGCLPAIRVRISSVSPLMFFEKFSQGGSIMRPEAAEQKEQRKFCEKMSSILEKIHEEVSRKLELEQRGKRVTRTRSRAKPSIASLKSGEEIFNAVENSLDPSQIMENLSSSQRRMLENFRIETEEKLRARVEDETKRRLEEMRQRNECPEERIVAPILKLMVCCSLSNIEVPLTVWRPNEDLRTMLRVGAVVTIYKANVTTCRKFQFGLTTKNNTTFEMYEESSEQLKPPKQPRLE